MKVYISHAYSDAALAEQVAGVLEAAGMQVWDGTRILPGENWAAAAANALQNSDAMVVLLTPESVESMNVEYDLGFALGRRVFKGRVVSIVAAPESEFRKNIPWVLHHLPQIHVPDPQHDVDGLKGLPAILRMAA